MTFASVSQFHVYLLCLGACLAYCLNSVLNVKALVGALNQEKALVGDFSVIVKTDGSFTALVPACTGAAAAIVSPLLS